MRSSNKTSACSVVVVAAMAVGAVLGGCGALPQTGPIPTYDGGVADAARAPDVPRVDPPTPTVTPDAGVAAHPADAGSPPPPPADAGSPPPPPPPPPGTAYPGVAAFDAATAAHVREVRARGTAMGNRPTVFAKIGDSITESGSFLQDIGNGWYDLGTYTALAPTVAYFSATTLDEGRNSFSRASACATAGWQTTDALAGPLEQELADIRPMYAVVMYGTNDLDHLDVATYTANMNRIVDIIEGHGTVAALSTIPDRADDPTREPLALAFGAAVRSIAAARHLPLIDYWAALQPVPNHGLGPDGIHPDVALRDGTTAPCDFTAAGLQHGYNVRNLTAVLMLDRLRTLP